IRDIRGQRAVPLPLDVMRVLAKVGVTHRQPARTWIGLQQRVEASIHAIMPPGIHGIGFEPSLGEASQLLIVQKLEKVLRMLSVQQLNDGSVTHGRIPAGPRVSAEGILSSLGPLESCRVGSR